MKEASFASLNSGLLARKGGAKPAMRPQLGGIMAQLDPSAEAGSFPTLTPDALEDLGWNDMGDTASIPQNSANIPQNRESADPAEALASAKPEPEAEAEPGRKKPQTRHVVHAQQEEIIRRMRCDRSTQRAEKSGAKPVAFTLRIDKERHLRLRLACTIHNRSAQHIVTQALDSFLEEMNELVPLAAQIARR